MTPTLEDQIDALYELPPGEFTAARNALAKTAGAQSTAVRALEKPTAPAWAVNQLYWRKRKTFDRVVATAADVRQALQRQLTGHQVDLAGPEAAHKKAIESAMTDIRALLKDLGEPASPATTAAILETLRALPVDGAQGRLSRPVKPPGFEALTGMFSGALAAAAQTPPAAAHTPKSAPADKSAPAAEREARAANAARQREREALAKRLTSAKSDEHRAESAVERAKTRLDEAKRDRTRLRRELDDAEAHVAELETALKAHEAETSTARAERQRIEMRFHSLSL